MQHELTIWKISSTSFHHTTIYTEASISALVLAIYLRRYRHESGPSNKNKQQRESIAIMSPNDEKL